MSKRNKINPNDPFGKSLLLILDMFEKKTEYEMHADGVKEVEVCPFCPVEKPCLEPHCPYTEEE